tara:strand:- start:1491 stop:2321 length:831 start_codon:yes stop_codon:yes gene_type:complete
MARFDYTKYLKQGGVEKYLMEADFGNDLQSRYDYVRPLMSRLPDTAYTESLIDGMEDGLRMDDKVMFDFYFVETMKALGLENELMEAEDSLINPEAEEIEDDDLAAAADYYDSLAENDNILDEFLEMPAQEEDGAEIEVLDDVEELEIEKEQEVTININLEEGKFKVGDLVYRKFDDARFPMKVVGVRKMFASPLQAVSVVGTSGGDKLEYDETQLIKLEEMEGEVQTENKVLKASNDLEDALNNAVDELTDDQIDSITDMILDLRDKVKAKLKKK